MSRWWLACCLGLVACAGLEPFDPPVAGELDARPGLFTGETGELVLRPFDGDGAHGTPPERRLTDPPAP